MEEQAHELAISVRSLPEFKDDGLVVESIHSSGRLLPAARRHLLWAGNKQSALTIQGWSVAGRCDVRTMAKETEKRLNKRFSKEVGWYWPVLVSGEGRGVFPC